MGIGSNVKLTIESLVQGHIQSMKAYADELDALGPMIKRRDVVNRIYKCAGELKDAVDRLKDNG